MHPIFRFLFLFLVIIFAASCKDRDRNNPFDPDNDDPYIRIGLLLNSKDSLINIAWNIPQKPDFKSFEIYRRIESEDDFALLAVVDKNSSSYTDIVSELGIRYYYYIKLTGNDVESPPTQTESILPGPGSVWMLDDYLWEILRLNYDLSATIIRKVGVWKPENLTFANEIDRGLITYPIYNYFEIFDLDNGRILYGNSSVTRPFDAVYDKNSNHFWLIDSLGSLFIVDSSANEQYAGKFFDNSVQIDLLDDLLFILDKGMNAIHIFDTSPQQVGIIDQNAFGEKFSNLSLFRVDPVHKNIYFLDKTKNNNTIYKYYVEKEQVSKVYQDSLIRTFDINQNDESIWIIIANKLNSDLLQLSSSGLRLHSIQGFNIPRDIKVNPYNGNVIVADIKDQVNLLEDKVFHYQSDILIGSFRTYGDPFKVYIE